MGDHTSHLARFFHCVYHSLRLGRGAGAVALVGLVLATIAPVCFAEGSRTLFPSAYPAAGFRAEQDLQDATFLYAGVTARRQFLYVYANAGEYILLGSSNRANGGDIFVYNPQSFGVKGNETIPTSANFNCGAVSPPPGSFSGGTRGQIVARSNELIGPYSADGTAVVAGGYAPCAYLATITGVYGVLFSIAPTGSGGTSATASVGTLHAGNLTVPAWEIAVRAAANSTVDIDARVFTYGFIANAAGNGHPLFHTLYYATLDGSRYQQTMRGLDPAGYALWGNAFAYLDSGQPLYRDIRGNNNAVSPGYYPAAIVAQLPQTPIFFSSIDPAGANAIQAATVLQALGIPLTPPSPVLMNPAFNGLQSGNQTYVSGGGTFTFFAQNDTSYQIVISAGTDFDPGNSANANLTGLAPDGNNSVLWNGLANNGTPFLPGTFNYQVIGRNGEIHFPIVDAEANGTGGPTLTKLNGDAGNQTVYYDDRGYVTREHVAIGTLNGLLCPGNPPVPPTPDHSLTGQDSNAQTFSGANCNGGAGSCYYRYWPGILNANTDCPGATSAFGDAKALDLWAYQQTATQSATIVINAAPGAATVATSVVVPATTTPMTTVSGSFNFQNVGGAMASGVTYSAVIGTPGNCPSSLAFSLQPVAVTFSYSATTCTVTLIGMPAGLASSQSLDFNFSYAAPSSGEVPITTTNDSVNGGNATASGTTAIVVADVTTTVTVPATALIGATVSGTIVYGDAGSATSSANGVTYTATIGTPGTCPLNVTFPTLPGGVTATYSSSSCQVTLNGIPTTLTAGQSLTIGFQYTVPVSGTVAVVSTIATSTPESTTSNNVSSGSTAAVAPPNITLTKTGPSSAVQGAVFGYTIDLGNSGIAASGAIVTVADMLPVGVTANSVVPGTDVTSVNCGSLPSPPGATLTCTVSLSAVLAPGATNGTASFSVNATATNTGGIINHASVDATGGTTPPAPGSGCAPVASCGSAGTAINTPMNITLAKVGAAAVVTNGVLVYTFSLGNSGGTASGTTLTVADVLPAGVTYQSTAAGANMASVACTGSVAISCTAQLTAGLAAGSANGAATFTVTAIAPGTVGGITNYASVDATGGTNPPVPGPECTPATSCGGATTLVTALVAPANITLAKGGAASALANGTLIYTLQLGNSGGTPSGTTLTVADALPPGMAFQSATAGTNVVAVTCSGVPLVCTLQLAAGLPAESQNGAATFAIATTAPSTGGSITNYASVDATGGTNPPAPAIACTPATSCASATTTVNPAPTATLQISNTGPATANAGDRVVYSITVSNVGTAAATNVVLTDSAPAGLSFVSSGAPCAGGFPCSLGTLSPGQSITVSPVTFAVAASVAGTFVNTASVVDDQTTQTSSSAATVALPSGGNPSTPIPIDSRWMLTALAALFAVLGAWRIRARLYTSGN